MNKDNNTKIEKTKEIKKGPKPLCWDNMKIMLLSGLLFYWIYAEQPELVQGIHGYRYQP